jgi:hypothetical protein
MLERLEPDTEALPENGLLTRQELFGGYSSRAEEGFQQRCLTRLCNLGVLDSLVAHPTRTRVYAVRDSSKVLDALTDDEALTRFIWHRPEADILKDVPPESSPPEFSPPEVSGTGVVDGGSSASVLAELTASSDEGLEAMTLKLLAGMVDSLYYLRTKVESIEQKLDSLTQGHQ